MPIRECVTRVVTLAVLALAVLSGCDGRSGSGQSVSFVTSDGATIYARRYGTAEHAVLLAHGGGYDKESWEEQAAALLQAGFAVLAIDFRGYGKSTGPGDQDPLSAPLHLDVIAAVRYLRQVAGASTVSAIGGSIGGAAVAEAVAAGPDSAIDNVVLLGSGAGSSPKRFAGRKLFILTQDGASGFGPILPGLLTSYPQVPSPKEMVVLQGSAHAQELFTSEHSERVMQLILAFLQGR